MTTINPACKPIMPKWLEYSYLFLFGLLFSYLAAAVCFIIIGRRMTLGLFPFVGRKARVVLLGAFTLIIGQIVWAILTT